MPTIYGTERSVAGFLLAFIHGKIPRSARYTGSMTAYSGDPNTRFLFRQWSIDRFFRFLPSGKRPESGDRIFVFKTRDPRK